jgi:hypothetical protein
MKSNVISVIYRIRKMGTYIAAVLSGGGKEEKTRSELLQRQFLNALNLQHICA